MIKRQLLNVLPFGALIFDYLENIGIVSLLSTYPKQIAGLAIFMSLANITKWLFVGASVLALLYTFGTWLIKKFK